MYTCIYMINDTLNANNWIGSFIILLKTIKYFQPIIITSDDKYI